MNSSATPVAVDMGSSSVRVTAGSFDGARLTLSEVARFPNEARTVAGRLVWPLHELVERTRAVLSAVADEGMSSVAVDSWGVDHVLVDASGHAVAHPASYRDARTRGIPDELARRGLTAQGLWSRTGIQPDPINTSHQLVATLRQLAPAERDDVARVLMVPDYVAHRLGAEPGWSRAICSTSGLAEPGGGRWADDLLRELAIPTEWFGDIAPERQVAGHFAGSSDVPVIRAGSHDTACAVHALPSAPGPRVFLSSGSWSLLGVETDRPLLDDAVRAAGFSNEVRTEGGIRLLRNLTGLWILQECVRQWTREGVPTTWAGLTRDAVNAPGATALLDPDDPVFQTPGDMPARVRDAVRRNGGRVPESPGEVARVVLDSLAVSYAGTVRQLANLTGANPSCVVAVGGGTRNDLLNQLTADACGLPVAAGAAEATSVGSLLAQLETLGEIGPNDRSAIVDASFDVRLYEPRASALAGLAPPNLERLS
ncbi:rhamnulokinase [Georgenia soli]|uniref:Rhamnulokinase n=1 Tax=Georgenia soli TaxID=638953 RepID=A0A2A9ES03_9MICO|nr:FGGY-family carbohydrate kinase [Georgenia soli]PFG41050.1 rhamnulokinase [Georgenia soli]